MSETHDRWAWARPDVGWPAAFALLALVMGLAAFWIFWRRPVRGFALAAALARLTAIGAAWAVWALAPTWTRTATHETPSRLLVALDASSSMDVRDPQRSPAERAALVALLGDEAVDATRRQIADALLRGPKTKLLERLAERHQVDAFAFHETRVDLAASDDGLRATDLTVPLAALADAPPGEGVRLGLILLSDGRATAGTGLVDRARELGARKLPIYAVPIGSATAPRQASVVAVDAPARAAKDADVAVEVRVRLRNVPAGEATVELFDAGPPRKSLGRKAFAHDGADVVRTLRLDVKFSDFGMRRAEATLTAPASDPTRRATLVRVGDDKIRVLLVDGEARWEHHYLAVAFGRDPDLRVDRILFDAPTLKLRTDAERAAAQLPALRWPDLVPNQEDPLWQYDVIVLGDVSPDKLPRETQERLERYVAQREGTLVLSAGKRHLPIDYLREPDRHPLVKLLPVEELKPLTVNEGFSLSLAEGGVAPPFLQVANGEEDLRRKWAEMPPLHWALVGKPSPGARALLDVRPPGAAAPLAAAALRTYGLGRVVWLGFDGSWRWRLRVGDRDHYRFWGQLVRWAASESGSLEGQRTALFGTRKPVYAHAAAADAFLLLGPDVPDLAPATARLAVKKIGDDGVETSAGSVTLTKSERRPKLWEATLPKLAPGEYRVAVDVPELAGKLDAGAAKRDRFAVLPPEGGESADLSLDLDTLRTLAEASGGRLLTLDELARLPDQFAAQTAPTTTTSERRLWRDEPLVWYCFAALIALLALEWTCRKLAGLP